MIEGRHSIAVLVLAFGVQGCRSKHGQTPPEGGPDALAPSPAASARAAGDAASPDAGKDCKARTQRKKGSQLHPPLGQIIRGDGIQSHCLGDPVDPQTITGYGCKPVEEWHLCRVRPSVDLYYDKNWRLDVIRVNHYARWWHSRIETPRTPEGIGPGIPPDNVGWYWGLPLRTERVKDPDFGLVEVRYYHGVALEIERPPRGAPIIGGVYVFPMGRFPRLGPLAPAEKEPAKKQRP